MMLMFLVIVNELQLSGSSTMNSPVSYRVVVACHLKSAARRGAGAVGHITIVVLTVERMSRRVEGEERIGEIHVDEERLSPQPHIVS